jgi:hypothetical protein
MTETLPSKPGIMALIYRYWKDYLWRIVFSVTAVLIMALGQHLWVMGIPFHEFKIHIFFIPMLVGTGIGFFYTTIRLMQDQQHEQYLQLANKETQLINEIKPGGQAYVFLWMFNIVC